MILVSIPTLNRFWNFALTMVCMVNAELPTPRRMILVDDGTNDGSAETKRRLAETTGLFDETIWRPARLGKNTYFHEVMARVLDDSSVDLWLHHDDDLCFGPSAIRDLVDDYEQYLRRGVLFGFVNDWRDRDAGPCNGPLRHTKMLGGASFLQSRNTLRAIGNPFADPAFRQGNELRLWDRYREAGETLAYRDPPYPVQHTANAESVLNGHQENWRHLRSRDRAGRVAQIPPYDVDELHQAIDSGRLETFVRSANDRAAVKVLLPPAV